jgi:tRNA 5-methylaminomethyl-2-thiouridine biosynthesis bifunctional protein
VVLDTHFGSGAHFLSRWLAWRRAPAPKSTLTFMAVAPMPPTAAALGSDTTDPLLRELAAELARHWPPLTPDLHTVELDEGGVTLLLAIGSVERWLSQLLAPVNEFWLRGTAGEPPDWDLRQYKAVGRLAAAGGVAWVPGGGPAQLKALRTAGFAPVVASGPVLQTRLPANQDLQRRSAAPPGRAAARQHRSAVVIGAGLAGACAARALARQGLQVTVLDQAATPAAEASGNVAGLFHGVVHAQDGAHARWLRAGALRTRQLLDAPVQQGRVIGDLTGLLRGADADAHNPLPAELLAAQGLPPAYVQHLSQALAEDEAACPLTRPAWLYPGGGWVHPPGVVAWCLDHPQIKWQPHSAVARIASRAEHGWAALDPQGQVLAQADVLVLANAHGIAELLPEALRALPWPWQRRRGQVSQLTAAQAQGLPRPRRALTSGGYLVALPESLGGGLLCGATNQRDDNEPACRVADHGHNLAQITALTGQEMDPTLAQDVTGRVGWRLGMDDRLPAVGPLPVAAPTTGHRWEQPKHVPRVEGLYVLGALGSRGLSLAPLLGEVLAAWVCGAPMPVGADLLDAVDAARFVSRGVRQGRAARPSAQAAGLSSDALPGAGAASSVTPSSD